MVQKYLDRGGMLFVDDHNHDTGGVFSKTATAELTKTAGRLRWICRTRTSCIRASSRSQNGPPSTSHELNGWGDNLIHPHLQAVTRGDRIEVLYSNKDYSSEWGYRPDSEEVSWRSTTRSSVSTSLSMRSRAEHTEWALHAVALAGCNVGHVVAGPTGAYPGPRWPSRARCTAALARWSTTDPLVSRGACAVRVGAGRDGARLAAGRCAARGCALAGIRGRALRRGDSLPMPSRLLTHAGWCASRWLPHAVRRSS